MRKRTRVALGIVLAVFIVAGFVWWQVWQLGHGLRTIDADKAQEVLLSALSAEVFAPGVGVEGQRAVGAKPLLDQDPSVTHRRYALVMTWVHASQIFEAVGNWPVFEGKMVRSDSLTGVPAETRVDGWMSPYCIWIEPRQVVFMSSGGTGVLDCATLREPAQEATALRDARLTKLGKLLVTVRNRAGASTPLSSQ